MARANAAKIDSVRPTYFFKICFITHHRLTPKITFCSLYKNTSKIQFMSELFINFLKNTHSLSCWAKCVARSIYGILRLHIRTLSGEQSSFRKAKFAVLLRITKFRLAPFTCHNFAWSRVFLRAVSQIPFGNGFATAVYSVGLL